MTRTAMMTAIALTFAAPAFADMGNDAEDLVNLGKTSPAAIADEHNEPSDFMTEEDLGATSPAVINDGSDDVVSTMSVEERKRLENLGVTSPAELND